MLCTAHQTDRLSEILFFTLTPATTGLAAATVIVPCGLGFGIKRRTAPHLAILTWPSRRRRSRPHPARARPEAIGSRYAGALRGCPRRMPTNRELLGKIRDYAMQPA